MSNILYMAISQDGYIADVNDETPWSDDAWNAFEEFVTSCDVVLMGRRTFQIMQKNNEFIDGPHYVVATSNQGVQRDGFTTAVINSREDIPRANKLGIIGGGELNGRLAKMDAIDEIILDIEPIELKAGIRLFGRYDIPLKLKLLDSKKIGDATIQRHYRIVR
jgi:dihydrofolate reductase